MALGPLAAASVVVPPPSDKIAGGATPAPRPNNGLATRRTFGERPRTSRIVQALGLDQPTFRLMRFWTATVDQSVKRRKGERDSRRGLHRAVVASRLGPLPEELTDIRWSSGSTRRPQWRPGIVDGTINPADRDVLKVD